MHVASPEVCDNEDGYQEGAEGDGVAHGVHHVQPPEEVLLGGYTVPSVMSQRRTQVFQGP